MPKLETGTKVTKGEESPIQSLGQVAGNHGWLRAKLVNSASHVWEAPTTLSRMVKIILCCWMSMNIHLSTLESFWKTHIAILPNVIMNVASPHISFWRKVSHRPSPHSRVKSTNGHETQEVGSLGAIPESVGHLASLHGGWEKEMLPQTVKQNPKSHATLPNSILSLQLILREISLLLGLRIHSMGTSLVVQWLRILLPMQGARVQSLVQEDPTCCGTTKPVCHNYWACALEPTHHNYWSLRA